VVQTQNIYRRSEYVDGTCQRQSIFTVRQQPKDWDTVNEKTT